MNISETPNLFLDSKRDPWDTGSHRLWSLWTMLEFAAARFFSISSTLTELSSFDGVMLTKDSSVDEMTEKLDLLLLHAGRLNLQLTVKHIEFMKYTIRSGVVKADIWAQILTEIGRRVHDELETRTFLYVPSEDANLYNRPEASFANSYTFYPSARHDIREACKCHALGRYTASVYHSMGIAQAGMHLLARELGVSFSFPIILAEWGSVIDGIEAKIAPMKQLKRSAEKDELLTFYSECAVQFRYFKDAWRNHVGHSREIYDRDQSHSILLHVRDFMEKLSTRIHERQNAG